MKLASSFFLCARLVLQIPDYSPENLHTSVKKISEIPWTKKTKA